MHLKVTRPLRPAALVMLTLAASASAADHREAPLIREDLTADLNDVYAFLNPDDASRLVLAMTVNPFSAPPENVTYVFSPNVRYSFHIDVDGDAESDAEIDVLFENTAGGQTFSAYMPNGTVITGATTAPTEEPEPNPAVIVDGADGCRAFAGQRDDPFFFDVVGFARFLAGTGSFDGTDGFAGFNVSAIVIECPLTALLANADNDGHGDQNDGHADGHADGRGGGNSMGPGEGMGPLQIWGTTERRRKTVRRSSQGQLETSNGPWEQVDRMGNPAVNTALIPADLKDFYNIGQPANDAADFAGAIVASLTALGTDATNIGILASVAVPDTIKLDPTGAIGYPNGRAPANDVVDTLLFFIFNQTPVADGVGGNDVPFLTTFPYLAPPHQPR